MIVDLVLGAIFITAIICFTIYKTNKNNNKNVDKKKKDKFKNNDDFDVNIGNNIDVDSKKPAIGFQFKRDAKTLRKEEKKNGKKR